MGFPQEGGLIGLVLLNVRACWQATPTLSSPLGSAFQTQHLSTGTLGILLAMGNSLRGNHQSPHPNIPDLFSFILQRVMKLAVVHRWMPIINYTFHILDLGRGQYLFSGAITNG